jgi:hypothetical protein
MRLWGLSRGPTLIGGDFNLVRSQREKSNGQLKFSHAKSFNNWINTWGLIEIMYPGRTYS